MPLDTASLQPVGLKNVSKYFETSSSPLTVLDRLSIEFHPGKVTALVGPSGCGKTTILNILAGIETPSSGEAKWASNDRRRLGYVFQRDRLLPWRTMLENSIVGMEILGDKSGETLRRARALLTTLGLHGFEDAYPETLSEGMRQRVALCRALLIRPQLLLLDEPMSSLDVEAKLIVEDMVRLYTHSEMATTVLVTHDLDEAIAMADVLVLLTSRPASVRGSWRLTFRKQTDNGRTIREGPEFKAFLSDLVNRILESNAAN